MRPRILKSGLISKMTRGSYIFLSLDQGVPYRMQLRRTACQKPGRMYCNL